VSQDDDIINIINETSYEQYRLMQYLNMCSKACQTDWSFHFFDAFEEDSDFEEEFKSSDHYVSSLESLFDGLECQMDDNSIEVGFFFIYTSLFCVKLKNFLRRKTCILKFFDSFKSFKNIKNIFLLCFPTISSNIFVFTFFCIAFSIKRILIA